MNPKQQSTTKLTLKYFWRKAMKYKWILILNLFGAFLAIIGGAFINPLIFKEIFDLIATNPDAPILILDEATSALDSKSEKEIQKAFEEIFESENRTTIVIAHRLSTLRKMDRIIVMDEGKIVEEGSHNTLVKKNGKYAELWNHQVGGFVG